MTLHLLTPLARPLLAVLVHLTWFATGCVHLSPREQLALNRPEPAAENHQFSHWVWMLEQFGDKEPECTIVVMHNVQLLAQSATTLADLKSLELPSPTELVSVAEPDDVLVWRVEVSGMDGVAPFECRWAFLPVNPVVSRELRSPFLLLSYPLWGLPRDLLDVPLTFLRRSGFDRQSGPAGDNPASAVLILGGAAVGAVAGFALASAIAPAGTAGLIIALGAGVVGIPVGALVGMYLSFPIGDVMNFVFKRIQTPVLRGSIDSIDYFPSWRFVLHRPVVTSLDGEYRWWAF